MTEPLRVFIIDDEQPARNRLRDLLSDCAQALPLEVVGEASGAPGVPERLTETRAAVVLLDIHMPETDGLTLAQRIRALNDPPQIIFVTAYDRHAIEAFEVEARDYLLKPVRAERLLAALRKVQQTTARPALPQLRITERGETRLVPLDEILWLRAELKYITVHTLTRDYLLEDSLNHLEQSWPEHLVRIHRNTLVARHAIAGLRSIPGNSPDTEPGLEILLKGETTGLPVSRRLHAAIRQLVREQTGRM